MPVSQTVVLSKFDFVRKELKLSQPIKLEFVDHRSSSLIFLVEIELAVRLAAFFFFFFFFFFFLANRWNRRKVLTESVIISHRITVMISVLQERNNVIKQLYRRKRNGL